MIRARTYVFAAAALVLFLFAISCVGFWIPGIEVGVLLLVGWVPYLSRVVPKVTVRWDLLLSTVVYVAALAIGAHFFLWWLYREMRRGDGTATEPAWKWRWTLAGLALVLLLFASGTAMVGVVHQAVWLARSPEPMYRRGALARDRIKCASNVRQIGQGIRLYANANGGRYPDDLRALLANVDLEAHQFVCPASEDEPSPGETLEQRVENLLKGPHCSYVYLGKGLADPVEPKRVILVEPLENHDGGGMTVLYADSEAKWIERPEAERVLTGLGFERVEPPARR